MFLFIIHVGIILQITMKSLNTDSCNFTKILINKEETSQFSYDFSLTNCPSST